MTDLIKKEIELLKDLPGSYQMYDENNKIIYIGKAKNLKKRVSQYFLRPQVGKTAAMVSHVHHFETIVTNSEKEALILEMNLIQKYHPRYNILLMDDKHYPYIELHKNIKDPYVSIARNLKNKKSEYFGPYPSSSSAYLTIDIINSIFPLRKCNNVPKSPCLYYHLGQCLAPCINKINVEEYEEILKNISQFLKGNNKDVLSALKEKIEKYSLKMDYENALETKKMYDSLLYINENQNVEFIDKIDRDFIAFYKNENYISLVIQMYRKGLLIGQKNFFYELIGEIEEFVADMILQYYSFNTLPKEIYISNEEIINILENYLNTTIIQPKQGKNLEVINITAQNAKNYFSSYIQTNKNKEKNEDLLILLGKLLNIPTPYYIELFDNSHLQGTNAIGAMVAYINGEENKKMNRKFNIESFNKKDDLSSMKEVLFRRYRRLKEENQVLPDLIILDGGINQIKVAKEVMESLDLNINLAGLVKNDKHQTRALMNSSFNEIKIDDKNLFLLLTRMQDSVHNYAISTHINKRNKSMFNSIFDEVKGIGEKRKELLIKQFPTLDDLKKASVEELSQFIPLESAIELAKKIGER